MLSDKVVKRFGTIIQIERHEIQDNQRLKLIYWKAEKLKVESKKRGNRERKIF